MLYDGGYSKTGLVPKILFQRGENDENVVEHSYHSNTSAILKLSLKCQVVFMLTENVYFVKIERLRDMRIINESSWQNQLK